MVKGKVKIWTNDIKKIGVIIWTRQAIKKKKWEQIEEVYMSNETLSTK